LSHVEHQDVRRGNRLARRSSPATAILSFMSVSKESFTSSLASGLPLLVEVEHLEHVCAAAGQFLVTDGVDVQLVAGDVLGLGAFGGLEVDDRRLTGVQPGDQVDPAVDRDAGRYTDLDLLLGVQGVSSRVRFSSTYRRTARIAARRRPARRAG
jgi:hypothetical protein